MGAWRLAARTPTIQRAAPSHQVAFGATSVDHLADRLRERGREGPVFLTTRYLPKRHAEIVGTDGPGGPGGSMFWILKHQLIARSPILGFGEAPEGRVAIEIDPHLILVQSRPKRAHQGWRYLEGPDAPVDLAEGAEIDDAMPPGLIGKLSALALI